MQAKLIAAMTLVSLLPATDASAYCAKFVCVKAGICNYRVVSSVGPARNVNLYLGQEVFLGGLGPVTSYCDSVGGRCVTPMRQVQSLQSCQ